MRQAMGQELMSDSGGERRIGVKEVVDRVE